MNSSSMPNVVIVAPAPNSDRCSNSAGPRRSCQPLCRFAVANGHAQIRENRREFPTSLDILMGARFGLPRSKERSDEVPDPDLQQPRVPCDVGELLARA